MQASAMDCYGEGVTQLVKSGEPFEEVEDAIEELASLTAEQRAALWLLAFSLNERAQQGRGTPPDLAVVAPRPAG